MKKSRKIKKGYGGIHSFPIDFYAYNSKLRGVNPELKIITSLTAMIICICADNVWVSITVMAMSAFLVIVPGGLHTSGYMRVLRIPIAFVLLGTIAIGIGFSKTPFGDYNLNLHWFYLYATRDGLHQMLRIILRAMGAISCLFTISLTTPSHEFFTVLRRIHVPKLMVELMSLIYRFIFVLIDAFTQMRTSAESRMGFCDLKTGYRTFGMIASNLLVHSLRNVNVQYNAMESRCYDGDIRFYEEKKKIKINHIIVAICCISALALIWLVTRQEY